MRAFDLFKWKGGCILKCETIKMKLAKNIKKWIFNRKLFCTMQYMIKSLRCLCYLRILLNTYVINTFENFSFTVLIFFLVADQEQILATLSKAV